MSIKNPDLIITTITDNKEMYLSVFDLVKSRNKSATFENLETLLVVNYNNMDIGVVCLRSSCESVTDVFIYQLPNICRVSIISLIEATIAYLKSLNELNKLYSIYLEQSYYKSIVSVKAPILKEVTDTNLIISSNHLSVESILQITCKNVMIN